MSALRPSIVALAALTLVLVAACGTTTPSIAPSAPVPSEPPAAEAGDATWWVDSQSIPLAPETTTIKGFVMETACASGQSPEGRVNDPVIQYTAESVTVTFTVTPRPGVPGLPEQPGVPGRGDAVRAARGARPAGRRRDPAARRDHDPLTLEPSG